MDLNQIIRQIVDERLAEHRLGSNAEPELITPETAAEICGVGKDTILALVQESATNGFPSVRLSSRTIRIDKRRLASWFASGGLGVKA